LSAENSHIEDFLSVYKDREIIDFYKISENVYIAIIKKGIGLYIIRLSLFSIKMRPEYTRKYAK